MSLQFYWRDILPVYFSSHFYKRSGARLVPRAAYAVFPCSFAGMYPFDLILRYIRRIRDIRVRQIIGRVVKNAGDIWLIAFRTNNGHTVLGTYAVQGRYILAGEAEHQSGRFFGGVLEGGLHKVYKAGKIFCAVNIAENVVGL